MGRNTFECLKATEKYTKENGFEWAPLQTIFVCKQDRRCKAQLAIGRHVLDSKHMDCYANFMKSISQQLLMIIASDNQFIVLTGVINNAYLYADCDEKVYTRVEQEFEIEGYPSLPGGSLAKKCQSTLQVAKQRDSMICSPTKNTAED